MFSSRNNSGIVAGLMLTMVAWGGNNVAIKYLASRGHWPPVWIGCSRMTCVGLVMLTLLRWTKWFGPSTPLAPELKRRLWLQAGLSLALYVIVFTWAIKLTPASHVALYLGSSPVWALLWEGRPQRNWDSLRCYSAAALALAGVAVLFWPKLHHGGGDWLGDVLAVGASILWTWYSRHCRALGVTLSGAAITAESMWRAAVWLAPLALIELTIQGAAIRTDLVLVQLYSIICAGVVGFALWNNALRHWPTSQVFLVSNLIPVTTAIWARVCLDEPLTPTFIPAMLLIVAGVILGQATWLKPKTV